MIIKNLVKICSAYPLQFKFKTFENIYVYIRYRHGTLLISIGDPGKDVMSAVGGIEIYRDYIPITMEHLVNENYIMEILSGIPNILP